jgi:hypothetical protein
MKAKLRIIVFGTGKAAENFLLQSAQEYDILAFADNDEKKRDKPFWGYKVIDPKQISEFEFDRVIICSTFLLQIKRQLTMDLGLEPSRIVAGPKTALYAHKTFEPFRDEKTRDLAKDLILFLSEKFEAGGIPYFLDHGTLLGVIREGDVILWDDDIDVAVNAVDRVRVLTCLKENLARFPMGDSLKWSISLTYIETSSYDVEFGGKNSDGGLTNLLINGIKPLGFFLSFVEREISGINPFRISIVFNYFKDGTVYQSLNYAPEKFYLQADTVQFMGRNVKVPHKPEEYLEFHYGADWATPRKMTSYLELKNFQEPEAPGRIIIIAEST